MERLDITVAAAFKMDANKTMLMVGGIRNQPSHSVIVSNRC